MIRYFEIGVMNGNTTTLKLNYRLLIAFIFLIALVLFFQKPGWSEFYEYIDENGVKIFTDDQSKIPNNQPNKIKTHKERFDHLDEAEKQRLIREEKQRINQINLQIQKELEEYRKKELAAQQEAEEKQRELDRIKQEAAMQTPVLIANNQIFVPVRFTFSGNQVETLLLLDTGASITTMNESVGDQLEISGGKKAAAIVAGGGLVRTATYVIDEIQVGTKTLLNHEVMVFKQKGPERQFEGLLGQDFLGHFRYTIDYNKKVIQWLE